MKSVISTFGLWALSAAVSGQTLMDPGLQVNPFITGLSQPTAVRFINDQEAFIAQKGNGQVVYYNNGVSSSVLDLNVQNDSERGLLGVELHPDFANNGFVYLYHSTTTNAGDSNISSQWADNRVTRYTWNGTTLGSPAVIKVLGVNDPTQANGPNHNGGPMVFGPDGKLYVATGDLNRNRGEQNNTGNAAASSDVGGIFRLNDDGTVPADNPFVGVGNPAFEDLYAYGVRNSFGLAFDPMTDMLWDTENGPGDYDEVNLLFAGMNSGWRAIMGPDSRDPQNAPGDLVNLAGSQYSDPEFSFLVPVGITAIGFLQGSNLGPGYDDAVLLGNGNFNGDIYILSLNGARNGFDLSGVLADGVADGGETGGILFGDDFGIVTDIRLGPSGDLFVTSLTDGIVYRINTVPIPLPPGAWLLLSGLIGLLSLRARRRP